MRRCELPLETKVLNELSGPSLLWGYQKRIHIAADYDKAMGHIGPIKIEMHFKVRERYKIDTISGVVY